MVIETETHLIHAGVTGTDAECQVYVTGPFWLEAHGCEMLVMEIDAEGGTYTVDGWTVTVEITDTETDDDGNEVPTCAEATVTE